MASFGGSSGLHRSSEQCFDRFCEDAVGASAKLIEARVGTVSAVPMSCTPVPSRSTQGAPWREIRK
jgi:hypothetical protein